MAELIKTRTPGVYKAHRAKGTVYVARWREVDPATGKARVRDKTFPTEAAARQYRASVEHAQATGTYVPPNVGKVTVREVEEQWLAVQATRVRPRTLENYERGLRLRVLPTFGARRLDSITSRDVERWVVEMGPVMPGTVKHATFPLSATLNYARKHGLIQSNPCEVVDRPKRLPTGREKREGHFLSRAQVAAAAARCAETEPVYGLLVRFAAGVGLRRSEIAGLRVRDLRMARREVHVERMAERTYPGGVWVIQDPKSARSRRRVPILDDELLHDLGLHLAAHPRRDQLDAPLWPARPQRPAELRGRGAVERGQLLQNMSSYRRSPPSGCPPTRTPGSAFTTCGSQWLADGHDMFSVSRGLGHHFHRLHGRGVRPRRQGARLLRRHRTHARSAPERVTSVTHRRVPRRQRRATLPLNPPVSVDESPRWQKGAGCQKHGNCVFLEAWVPSIAMLATIVGPICLLLGWLAYLRFARWLVQHTGDPASLAHAATLARAVRKQPDAPPGTDVNST
ncbi:tyrosine-type recombinase/integrase [Candidatus Blastococcus massiliensis]|uniref:tyrosine-type recombinase/integrase n=1 Tax=Candidatus Blastococcus massiliensis TaxID=1470358 RepID=UPI00058E0424|nr:site-specific integrase [Candidatus Blastococcus massiliensis]